MPEPEISVAAAVHRITEQLGCRTALKLRFPGGSPFPIGIDAEELVYPDAGDYALPERRYDLVYVDPWHTYEHSRRDLERAAALAPVILCHDTWPERIELVRGCRDGWSGATFWAWLDFCLERGCEYRIVTTWQGLGVAQLDRLNPWSQRKDVAVLALEWQSLALDAETRYRWLSRRGRKLLHLSR